jgi:excinuclease ABC subunit C
MPATELEKRLTTIPLKPGVYIFKDELGQVIYVGKSARLRDRVRSYFRNSERSAKTLLMVGQIQDFELMFTDTEVEALILECNLIKELRPRYNIRLRDDKQYPYLRISMGEEWPRIHVARRIQPDGARYFGPYTDSKSVWHTLEILKRVFPYRACRKEITGKEPRPCLNYHIGRCLAPCTGATTRSEYLTVIEQMCMFLEGKTEAITRQLRARMNLAAKEFAFERAAFYRDRLHAIEKVTERQKIISKYPADEDIIAFAQEEGVACVQVFFVRGGKLLGREHFVMENVYEATNREMMASFLTLFYDRAATIPPKIFLQYEVQEPGLLTAWLCEKRRGKVKLVVPKQGEKRHLVEMAEQNAIEALREMRLRWMGDERRMLAAVQELGEQLGLDTAPTRIECYDISNIQGTSAVGSMVVFEKGQPKSGHYRRFRIKTVQGADDYASLREVFSRRFKRASAALEHIDDRLKAAKSEGNGSDAWCIVPDLVLVDGGKGQLGAAAGAMREAGFESVPVAALAKEREEIFLPGRDDPLLLPRGSQSLFLVQRVRDEAHRFALAYHHRVRAKQTVASPLDEVPGIGPRRKARLLKRFGSIAAIRAASIEDLAATVGMTQTLAERVKQYL